MICGAENGTNGCHLAVFSVGIAFALHFMALHQPYSPPLQDCLWYWLYQKNYLKLQAIWLAIHSPVGGQIDNEYPQNHGELLVGICFPSQGTVLQIIKTGVFNIYNCVWKPAVLKSSHIFYYVHKHLLRLQRIPLLDIWIS